MESRCSACGEPAVWLITAPYGPEAQAGRLLLRCEKCQHDAEHARGVAIPIAVVRDAPDAILAGLYQHGFTESDPETAAEVIGIPAGRWTQAAQQAIDGRVSREEREDE